MATLEAAIKSAMLRYGLIGKSPLYLAAMEQALKVAPVDLSVLIIGESGSGKEVFPLNHSRPQPTQARKIHGGELWCNTSRHHQ